MTFEEISQQTPCYIIDETLLTQNLCAFDQALKKYWNHYHFGYSVKTNPLPWILQFMKQHGCFAEVVSDSEYELAQHIGFSADTIIFNGPIKGHEQFLYALHHKTTVNIDSKRELDWLIEAASFTPCEEFRIGLRINFDLEAVCPEESLTDGCGNRFGFSVENGAFAEILKTLSTYSNIHVSGLHMHTNSKTRSLQVFQALSRQVCFLAEKYDLHLDYIDIGGSFFVRKGDFQAYDDYIRVIAKELSAFFHPKETALIIEPGSAVISTPVSYLTKVIDVKDTHRDRFVITDGGRLHIDPFMRKTAYVYKLLNSVDFTNIKNRVLHPKQVLCGFSCMETDRIMTVNKSPELSVDDFILYDMTGGYTLSLNALFINYLPNVFVHKTDGSYILARKKWGLQEYLQNNYYTEE